MPAGPSTGTRSSTVCGSTFETVPSARFATQTAPAPAATAFGRHRRRFAAAPDPNEDRERRWSRSAVRRSRSGRSRPRRLPRRPLQGGSSESGPRPGRSGRPSRRRRSSPRWHLHRTRRRSRRCRPNRLHDLIRRGVDARDRAVEPVRHPHDAAADGYARRSATDLDRLPHGVRRGSMRETVLSFSFVTQTASGPTATTAGASPTGISETTLPLSGSITPTAFAPTPAPAVDPPPSVRSTPMVTHDRSRGKRRADQDPPAGLRQHLAISAAAASASSPSRPSNGEGAVVLSAGKSSGRPGATSW